MIGSSPLARGLLTRIFGVRIVVGIIPARAGFTMTSLFKAMDSGDHPRSRGVYTGGDGFEWGIDGSSPLARGLRRSESAAADRERIIPARAGFTSARRS